MNNSAQKVITIVDYGMGNIGSLENMLRKVGAKVRIGTSPADIDSAERLLLPGIGHFDNAMSILNSSGLRDALERKVIRQGTPILCICLGAQLITEKSEEGGQAGLGWIAGRTVRFKFGNGAGTPRIPHMGWNEVVVKKQSMLFHEMYPDASFYFVHSFHMVCDRTEDILTTTAYGYEFVSAIERGNIYATQFHPEKSHKFGMRLLRNFAELRA